MNIHPAFVHFPIALLTLYALCEFVWAKSLRENVSWFWWKFGLLFFGSLGSLAALKTGQMAASLGGEGSKLLETHGMFGFFTVLIFLFLTIIYLADATVRGFLPRLAGSKIFPILNFLKRYIVDTYIICLLALVGLVFVTITGALGGAMVYGTDADPFVKFIYGLFF